MLLHFYAQLQVRHCFNSLMSQVCVVRMSVPIFDSQLDLDPNCLVATTDLARWIPAFPAAAVELSIQPGAHGALSYT